MSTSSIGSGPSADNNENHPGDAMPSKTMGAETGSSQTPEHRKAQQEQESAEQPAGGATGAALASPDELLGSVTANADPDNPGDFPDGPNVAPSPWEKDAAQGKG